jgi:hypothetical protein
LGNNPLLKDPLDNNPLKNNPLKNNPLKNNPLKNNPLKNNPLKNNPLKNNPLKDNPSENNPLKNYPLENNPLKSAVTTMFDHMENNFLKDPSLIRQPRSADHQNFDPNRAKRHRQQQQVRAVPNNNRAAPQTPIEVQPQPQVQPQSQVQPHADRRFFQPEHASSNSNQQSVTAPEEFPIFTPSTPSPPPIYYDFQPSSSSSSSTSKQNDLQTIYHDSLALPESFEPTFALPPPIPSSSTSSQRYQSYPTTTFVDASASKTFGDASAAPTFGDGSATPSFTTTSKPFFRETFPGQVLIDKQQVMIFC